MRSLWFLAEPGRPSVEHEGRGFRQRREIRPDGVLEDDGVLVMITGEKVGWIRPVDRVLGGVIRSRFWSQRFVSQTARADRSDLLVLKEMVESGRVKPVMDRRFSLEDAADALAYQSEGHARGKSVVIP